MNRNFKIKSKTIDLIIKKINHCDINDKKLTEIIDLKMTVWNYDKESQLKWIYNNMYTNDVHYMMYDNGLLIGYMFICNINITVKDDLKNVYGISNVCIRKNYQNRGYGSIFLNKINNLYKNNPIILMTTKKNIHFYEKANFQLYNGIIYINNIIDDDVILFYRNFHIDSNELLIDRRF